MKPSSCLRCGSTDIVPDLQVTEHDYTRRMDTSLALDEYPTAMLLKNVTYAVVRGALCAECGHVELYCPDATRLVKRFKSLQQKVVADDKGTSNTDA